MNESKDLMTLRVFSILKNKKIALAMQKDTEKKETTKQWLKRIGWAGILFFTIKGTITTYLIFQAGKCALD